MSSTDDDNSSQTAKTPVDRARQADLLRKLSTTEEKLDPSELAIILSAQAGSQTSAEPYMERNSPLSD